MGGFGSAVLEFAADHGYSARIKRLGIPDEVIEHGEQMELYRDCGYDVKGIKKAVTQVLEGVKA
jgi:1-deoxy-D-xylulose-5-phosphate synthase